MSEYQKMDPELKAKWTAALRSGEYTQTRFRLQRPPEGYCCLGVLSCLLGRIDEGYYPTAEVGGQPTENDLINLNDYEGYDFPTIADWIEENL